MKKVVLSLILIISAVGIWSESLILPLYVWDTQRYIPEPIDSEDPQQLMLAAMYYNNLADNSEGKTTDATMSKSLQYISSAYRKSRRKDPVITTLYSMISLMNAGQVDKLQDKIRYSTQGINGFETAKQMLPGNFEVLALRVISTIEVPTYFNDQTDGIINDGKAFLEAIQRELTPEESEVRNRYIPIIYISLAECMARKKNGDMVKKYLNEVIVEDITNPQFQGVVDLYNKLAGDWL